MYCPAAFSEQDPQRLQALIRDYPLATWITPTSSGIQVNHIPFMLDISRGAQGVLMGHVARANPVWQEYSRTQSSVVVFNGPQAYISPSFYASKALHGKVVPTWNYAVVHAHGIPRVIDEREEFRALLTRLTDINEAGFQEPWKLGDAPDHYIDTLMKAIVGIEIPLDCLEGKIKNSQNRDADDRAGVKAALQRSDREQARILACWIE